MSHTPPSDQPPSLHRDAIPPATCGSCGLAHGTHAYNCPAVNSAALHREGAPPSELRDREGMPIDFAAMQRDGHVCEMCHIRVWPAPVVPQPSEPTPIQELITEIARRECSYCRYDGLPGKRDDGSYFHFAHGVASGCYAASLYVFRDALAVRLPEAKGAPDFAASHLAALIAHLAKKLDVEADQRAVLDEIDRLLTVARAKGAETPSDFTTNLGRIRELEGQLVHALNRIGVFEEDLAEAAGECLVDVPEPGTPLARVMLANVLLRRQLGAALSPKGLEPADLRAELARIMLRCAGAEDSLAEMKAEYEGQGERMVALRDERDAFGSTLAKVYELVSDEGCNNPTINAIRKLTQPPAARGDSL